MANVFQEILSKVDSTMVGHGCLLVAIDSDPMAIFAPRLDEFYAMAGKEFSELLGFHGLTVGQK